MADLTRKTANLFDVLDYTDIQTSTNGGASNVVKTSSTISFKSNGENDYSGIYIPTTYYSVHINDYDVSTAYTLSADVYTDVPCTIIFGGSATIVSIPAGTSRLSYKFFGNIALAFYIRNTTANITLSKIMFAINDTTYEPYYPHSLRKLTTATETLSLPQTIYADGTAATLSIEGNTVQNGTPTPSNPVDVNGVGERTGNLFNLDTWYNSITSVRGNGTIAVNDGVVSITSNEQADAYTLPYLGTATGVYKVSVLPNTNYTVTAIALNIQCICLENGSTSTGYLHTWNGGSTTFTTQSDTTFLTFRFGVFSSFPLGTTGTVSQIMVNSGSTALPYEPYGYKIPISSNSTTTPIYLGEVETTRKIGKINLSEVSWTKVGSILGLWRTVDIPNVKYVSVNTELGAGIAEKYTIHTGTGMAISSNCIAIDVSQVSVNTGSDTETPTGMFWYALATEETGIVNGPLMKIGDYADTLSNAMAIPTTEGANSITVDTTVQPSEFTATWTGWHDASVKEYDGSQWNE